MKYFAQVSALFVMLAAVTTARGDDYEVVLEGLNNPCGVAIQPETGTIFVSDSGAGRVIKLVDGKAVDVITDFPKDVYGKGPMYDIGPLGLCFLDQNTLVIGGGGLPDGEELLRVYDLSGGETMPAKQMKASFSLPGNDDIKGEGNFYAVVATKNAIFVSCNGDDTKGWVSRAVRKGDKIGPFERYLATKEAVQVDAPVGLAISEKGHLVVGQMGEITLPGDSLLSFYNPKSKKLLMNLETGLHDITGLAYSNKTGQLYATDFAWIDTNEGGLFQMIAKKKGGEAGVTTKKIASLDKPTALTFSSDGSLYATIIGSGKDGGKLIRFKPGL